MKLGSLCTGYGGLDLAAEAHYGAETVWVGEYNPQASAVLEHRFPVPNLTDLTAVDWSTVEPVDVLTAGYPCQPFSHAGRRKGTEDDRHIWPHIADAVRVLRPGRVVLENVAGHLSLGFGDVLGDLAALGYDTRWCCVRASDAGAPHRRERVFVVARDASGAGTRRDGRGAPPTEESARRGEPHEALAPVATGDAAPPDPGRVEPLRRHGGGGLRGAAGTVEGEARQRQRSRDTARYRRQDAPDTDGDGFGGVAQLDGEAPPQLDGQPRRHPDRRGVEAARGATVGENEPPVDWGDYAPAITRWEHTIGRPAPHPTDTAGRLNPRFVEWMMGLPDGWVTDLIPQRTHALRILGNGVVPQQAALALAMLDPDRATS